MFTNSGMVQFKDIFLGKESVKDTRAASCQKCLRAGGKHNDLDNVGYTKRHLTFFEMLGNFSFGDYFKEQAILYAWEFIRQELRLEDSKLYVTVYHDDAEAYRLWKKISGFADDKIIRISSKDNFWSMGDIGPCGPCSEIFYDQGEALQGGLPGSPNQNGDRYVEIWNLVFMQYEQSADGTLAELSKCSIDTGMGLERIAAVVQGVCDNFEIDLFRTLIKASVEISKSKLTEKNRVSHRIIADHLRACTFLIAEGILPSNEGRGYVLRRIMRRAIRHVHKLGCNDSMMYKLVPTLVHEMGNTYSELKQHEQLAERVLKEEEESFRGTLDSGMALLNSELARIGKHGTLSGEIAFKLHDTYGFPIDLTVDILREQDKAVDTISFEKCMAAQRQASRKAWVGSGEQTTEKLWFDVRAKVGETKFVGYETLTTDSVVLALVQDDQLKQRIDNENEFFMITHKTPFFAESGGQAGDVGSAQVVKLSLINKAIPIQDLFTTKNFFTLIKPPKAPKMTVIDTIMPVKNLRVHKCRLEGKGLVKLLDAVLLQVDAAHRENVKRNHTATHLLHASLRAKLGDSVVQKGSSVKNDGFRFDFSYSKPLSRTLLNEIETEINDLILKNLPVTTTLMEYEESLKFGAMALFGEKYDQEVRVVRVGEPDTACSMELCGGTHVTCLGEIGLVKILSEEAIASGVRRIEATSGHAAFAYLQKTFDELKEITRLTQAQEGKTIERIKNILNEQKQLIKDTEALKQKSFIELLNHTQPTVCGTVPLVFVKTDEATVDTRLAIQQFLSKQPNHAVLVLSQAQDKMLYVVGVGSKLHTKTGADAICKTIASRFNAKGGGSKLIAQGSIHEHGEAIEEEIKALTTAALNAL
jgi:alanyl-tRNA synthetase